MPHQIQTNEAHRLLCSRCGSVRVELSHVVVEEPDRGPSVVVATNRVVTVNTTPLPIPSGPRLVLVGRCDEGHAFAVVALTVTGTTVLEVVDL
jgi:hypothetical protein